MAKKLKKYWSIEELKSDYEYTSQGHWFSKYTMRFFKTRLTGNFREICPHVYGFISTEQGPTTGSPRRATVRIAKVTPSADMFCGYDITIETYGEFNKLTLPKARALLASLTEKDV